VTIQRDATDKTPYYWRAVTYDIIDVKGWRIGPAIQTQRSADSPLLDKMADNPDPVGLRDLSFTVVPDTFRGSIVLSPATPIRVNTRCASRRSGRVATLPGPIARAARPMG
jgi:hypothetical protein